MRIGLVIVCAIFICLSFACKREGASAVQTVAENETPAEALPLPLLPDSLSSASGEERAGYVAVHFWDAIDSVNPALRADTAFMEQSFANFAAILVYVPDSVRSVAVDHLLNKVRAVPADYSLIAEISTKYLDDPNSPMRSEELFIPFLRAFAADTIDAAISARADYRLTQALKNRPGTRTTDFRFVTRSGASSTLSRFVATDTTLLIFYDHDCDHCHEIITRISSPEAAIPYPVLAVDVNTDRPGWDATKDTMPSGWQVAFATDPVDDDGLYYLPALPSLYLLAPGGEVILKDFSI